MTIGYKSTEAALHAYTGVLSGIKLGQTYFSQLNLEYLKLIIELFKRLFENNTLDRKDDFLLDFQMFAEEMLRKYDSTSPYGYAPRSPFEKLHGIKDNIPKSKGYARDKTDEDDYSLGL